MSEKIKSFKELVVWQKSMDLCQEIYLVTRGFPKEEKYGLVSQIRRCAVSIPSNIAEGFLRGHRAEYVQFLYISYASGAELETQLLISQRIGFVKDNEFEKLILLLHEIMKMLNVLISRLKNSNH